MRSTIAMIAAATLLAGCDKAVTTTNTTAVSTDVASVNSVAPDMGNAAAPASAPAAKAVAYTCKPAVDLSVRYDNDAGPDGQAIVTVDGKDYTLVHVQSGSGARYEAQQGRSPGRTLVWWNKGTDGMLMEGKSGDPSAEETTIATCSQKG